jgi:hypothetical protein
VFDNRSRSTEFAPHPQMVGEHSVSADKLTYNSNCAAGSAFAARRCAAPIASLIKLDTRGDGQALAGVLDEIKADGDKGFAIKLKEPFRCCSKASARCRAWPCS